MKASARRCVNVAMSAATALAAGLVVLPLLLVFGFLMYQGVMALNWASSRSCPSRWAKWAAASPMRSSGPSSLVALAVVPGAAARDSRRRLPGRVAGPAAALDRRASWPTCSTACRRSSSASSPTAIVVLPIRHFSALAGGFALAIIMMPIVIRTTEELVRLVPLVDARGGARARRSASGRCLLRIVLRTARAGIVTGVMLAVARVAGETAPLLFTAFGNHFWHQGLDQPMASLPLQIFTYAISRTTTGIARRGPARWCSSGWCSWSAWRRGSSPRGRFTGVR